MNKSSTVSGGDAATTGAGRLRFLESVWTMRGILLAVYAGLLLYSQTFAFVWDEGFHLVAAQLILAGKRLYLDFCFPQPPLNVYWNAAWMSLFGEDWRVTHYVAAILTGGSVFLLADFVATHFPVRRWRIACAIAATLFCGANIIVFQFGTIAQAYGIGLFLSVAAFRMTIRAVDRPGALAAFVAGLPAGAAAGCTLLTAPVAVVLFVWIARYASRANRAKGIAAFACGAIVPFIPVLRLFAQAPRTVFFNLIEYQAIYRRVNWAGATPHDIDVFSSWLDSTQALLLGLLAVAGALFLWKRDRWEPRARAEYGLAGWISAALLVYIGAAHPTFERYFIFAVPFLTLLAIVGLYSVGPRLSGRSDPGWPAFLVCVLLVLALGKGIFDDRDSVRWKDYEKVASKVQQVTPRTATLFADEQVYFLLHWLPPTGMEFSYSHAIELPPAEESMFHIVSGRELKEQFTRGRFDTAETCMDSVVDKYNLQDVFNNEADVGDCSVFWGPKGLVKK